MSLVIYPNIGGYSTVIAVGVVIVGAAYPLHATVAVLKMVVYVAPGVVWMSLLCAHVILSYIAFDSCQSVCRRIFARMYYSTTSAVQR